MVDLAIAAPKALSSFFVKHAEAQDFLVFLLDDLLFVGQVGAELVKRMLDVLHVLLHPLHIECGLLRAVIPLRSHRRALRVVVIASSLATLLEEWRLDGLAVLLLSVVDLGSFLGDELSSLKTSLVLLFHHVDLQLVVLLEEVNFIFESAHGLLRADLLFLRLGLEARLELLVLFLERLKDFFFVLQLGLQTLSHLLELPYVILHVLKQHLLLLLLLLFIGCMSALLDGDVLLELVEERGEFPLEVIVDPAQIAHSVTQVTLLLHQALSAGLQGLARVLQLRDILALTVLKACDLIDERLSQLGSLDLVLKHGKAGKLANCLDFF